jgi:xylitol oxidase
MASWRQKVTSV